MCVCQEVQVHISMNAHKCTYVCFSACVNVYAYKYMCSTMCINPFIYWEPGVSMLAALLVAPRLPRWQGSWGQHGVHLGPTGPRWAHDGPMNFAVWVVMTTTPSATWWWQCWPCGGSLFIPTNNSRAVFSSTSSLDIAYHQCCLHTAYWVLKDFICF